MAGKADHRVAVFSIDAATGALRFVETVRDDEGGVDGLQGASSVAVSPKGKYLYVTGNWAQAIAVFRVVTP